VAPWGEDRLALRGLFWRVLGILGPVCLAASEFAGKEGWLRSIFFSCGIVLVVAYFIRNEITRGKILAELRRKRVEDVLRTAQQILAGMGSLRVRGNVMVVVADPEHGERLQMRYNSGSYREEEEDNYWTREDKSVATEAWVSKRAHLGGEPAYAESELKREDINVMKLLPRPETREAIKTVLSVPVRPPGKNRVFAVLNFDDEKPLPDSALRKPEVIQRIVDLAQDSLVRALTEVLDVSGHGG
jgi:hypothetical protein